MEKNRIFLIFLVSIMLVSFSGCLNSEKSDSIGDSVKFVEVSLDQKKIKNAETTQLWIDVKNSENKSVFIKIEIIPEETAYSKFRVVKESKLIEKNLEPDATLGRTPTRLTGYCGITECKYSIIVRLIEDEEVKAEKKEFLIVENDN